MEEYWEREDIGGETKETWARLRCGNIGKDHSKGYKDTKCAICQEKIETTEHILTCKEARKEIRKEIVDDVEKWIEGNTEEGLREKIEQTLRGKEPVYILCQYVREFERQARKKDTERQIRREEGEGH